VKFAASPIEDHVTEKRSTRFWMRSFSLASDFAWRASRLSFPPVWAGWRKTLFAWLGGQSHATGLEAGIPACVTVTVVDGLVLSRSAFDHSINYRSVVAFGKARGIADPGQKIKSLRVISEHLIPGRSEDVRELSEKELKATTVLEFTIEEASSKVIGAGRQGLTP
jgi:nitroimidazol reductase NimA-like FMN-containing flavoprotein (pyridoxamine 5'-phosphate oxidase superfamily)